MLHVSCDFIGIAQLPFFEIQDGCHVFCTLSEFKAFLGQFSLKSLETELKRF